MPRMKLNKLSPMNAKNVILIILPSKQARKNFQTGYFKTPEAIPTKSNMGLGTKEKRNIAKAVALLVLICFFILLYFLEFSISPPP